MSLSVLTCIDTQPSMMCNSANPTPSHSNNSFRASTPVRNNLRNIRVSVTTSPNTHQPIVAGTLVNPKDKWVLRYSPIINYFSQCSDSVSGRYLEDGLKHGFKLQFSGPRISKYSKNVCSASDNEDVLLEEMRIEDLAGRMSGPYLLPPCLIVMYPP